MKDVTFGDAMADFLSMKWLKTPEPPTYTEPRQPRPDCKHLNSVVRGMDPPFFFYCEDCAALVEGTCVLNNFLDEMRKELKHD